MNIQTITKLLTDAGIEENEAKIEVKILLEHFCHYTELDKCKGVELTDNQLDLLRQKVTELENKNKDLENQVKEVEEAYNNYKKEVESKLNIIIDTANELL